jgi:hypothetical protein
MSFEYAYGGSLQTNILGSAPVALYGLDDVFCSLNWVDLDLFAASFNSKFGSSNGHVITCYSASTIHPSRNEQ